MAETLASEQDLSRLGKAVLDFQNRYERLNSVAYGAAIARTGDNALMQEYGNTLAKMESVKRKIEAVEGAWQRAKEFVGLGALPLVPLAVIAALIVTVVAAVKTMDSFMRRADIRVIQTENPGMTYDQAAARYNETSGSVIAQGLGVAKIALWVGGGFLAFKILGMLKR